jgi:hypothetical protein
MSYNAWLYTYANPILYTDPSGKWTCAGHPDCNQWVTNALQKLESAGETGKRLFEFFKEYDARIAAQQDVWLIYAQTHYPDKAASCSNQSKGLLIRFGTPWPGGLANTFYDDILQMSKTYIVGPDPSPDGILTLGHEISHYKQGIERYSIQGEILAQLIEEQLRVNIGGKEPDQFYKELRNKYPFSDAGLLEARKYLSENSTSSYKWLPLMIIGLSQQWLIDLSFDMSKLPPPPTPPNITPPKIDRNF